MVILLIKILKIKLEITKKGVKTVKTALNSK